MPEAGIKPLFRRDFIRVQHIWRHYLKRSMDIMGSLAGILLCLPLWGISAILIVLGTPGPVFYRQVRLGKYGKPFVLWKLRTMVADAERESGPVWSRKGDRRVTRIGRFLRRWHIDETPQFFNVLIGDMSIIGPRPEQAEIIRALEYSVPDYRNRLQVRPGITGLAQIRQNYDSCIRDVQRKVRYDVLYIRKMCAYLDMKILYLTALRIIHQKDD